MGKLKYSVVFAVLMVLSTKVFAKQITIQLVQHTINTEKLSDPVLVVEDELLNGFFESGFIVTNSPAVISSSREDDEALYNTGFGDAFEGSSDYFVQVNLYFGTAEGSKINLNKIEWSLASAVTGVKITEDSVNNVNTSRTDDLRYISSNLVRDIKKALKA
ncbi:MAG: hypothetical protein MJ188_07700 [Treponema sp.]|nr:hypothetical protein [Treponema sp.]